MHRGTSLRCLVTGASGFVGARLVQSLAHTEVDTWSVRRKIGHPKSITWADVASVPPHTEPFDYVFHLAAMTDLSACNADPARAQAVNALGARHAVDLAHQAGARLVYLSTLGVYGEPIYLPVDEEHPTNPIEAYSTSKLRGEQMTIERATQLGVSWAIIRSFNVYGPGQQGDRIVPTLVRQAIRSSTIQLRGTETTRDFVYVDDLCEAIWLVARSGREAVFNVGTGVETSILQLANMVGDLMNATIVVQRLDSAAYPVVSRSQANIARIMSAVGWRPRTSLVQGLKATLGSYGIDRSRTVMSTE